MKKMMTMTMAAALILGVGCMGTPSRTATAKCGAITVNVWPGADTNAVAPVAFEINTAYVSNETGGSESQSATQRVEPQTDVSVPVGTGGGSSWGSFFSGLAGIFGGSGSAAKAADAAEECVGEDCAVE